MYLFSEAVGEAAGKISVMALEHSNGVQFAIHHEYLLHLDLDVSFHDWDIVSYSFYPLSTHDLEK